MMARSAENFENSLDHDPACLDTSYSLIEALEIASDFVGESIPVKDGDRFIGAITEGDLFKKVLAAEETLRASD